MSEGSLLEDLARRTTERVAYLLLSSPNMASELVGNAYFAILNALHAARAVPSDNK